LLGPIPETKQYKGQSIEIIADFMLTSSKNTVQEFGYALKELYYYYYYYHSQRGSAALL